MKLQFDSFDGVCGLEEFEETGGGDNACSCNLKGTPVPCSNARENVEREDSKSNFDEENYFNPEDQYDDYEDDEEWSYELGTFKEQQPDHIFEFNGFIPGMRLSPNKRYIFTSCIPNVWKPFDLSFKVYTS